MVRGVNEQFLHVLDKEKRTTVRNLALAILAAIVLYYVAELADFPRFGRVVGVYVVGLALGIAAGLYVGFLRGKRTQEGLRRRWNAWMRASPGSGSLAEIQAKVKNRAPLPAGLWGLAVLGVGILNVVVFAMLWFETNGAPVVSSWASIGNGLVVGAWIGVLAWHLGFVRRFGRALDELIAENAVGVWGEY